MASYSVALKHRRMAYKASATAGTIYQTTPTDLRGMSGISFHAACTGVSGGSDSATASIQVSHDKSTWYDLLSFTDMTAATSESKMAASGEDTPLPRWGRVKLVVATGATITGFEVKVAYNRRGDGSQAPTKAAQTTPTGAMA